MRGCLPVITAHTGCENTPENSIESLVAGRRAGADIVEIDVRSTRDGQIVLMHDESVDTTSRNRVPVTELSLRELRELEATGQLVRDRADAKIATLEEALRVISENEWPANLDLKDDAAVEALVYAIESHDISHLVVISGCDPERARLVKRHRSGIPVLLNVESMPVQPEEPGYTRHIRELCTEAISIGCCGLNSEFSLCTSELVEHARYRYLPVSVWTVDRPDDMRTMVDMGVHSITTYHPGRLTAVAERAWQRQG